MPDLEQRIRDALDRLGERPDPARIVENVSERKRHQRFMRRVQTATLVVVVLAGTAGGVYGLSRVFVTGASRPSPGSTGILPGPSPVPSVAPSAPASPTGPAAGIPLCSDRKAVVTVVSQTGAAGTIRTVWRVTNTGKTPCHSYGYPGMDFHTSTGWLNVQVHRGTRYPDNRPPRLIVVPSGQSLYFVSYWSDVNTPTFPKGCDQFDRVKVTLPDNRVSAEVASSGCLNPQTVYVGAVTRTPPS